MSELQFMIGTWGEQTFGIGSRGAIVAHLLDEVEELKRAEADNPDILSLSQMEEAADCAILLFQYAHAKNFDLSRAVQEKMTINRARQWGTPDARGVVRHKEAER